MPQSLAEVGRIGVNSSRAGGVGFRKREELFNHRTYLLSPFSCASVQGSGEYNRKQVLAISARFSLSIHC